MSKRNTLQKSNRGSQEIDAISVVFIGQYSSIPKMSSDVNIMVFHDDGVLHLNVAKPEFVPDGVRYLALKPHMEEKSIVADDSWQDVEQISFGEWVEIVRISKAKQYY